VFVVATITGGQLGDLEVFGGPPTFHLARTQVCRVANIDGGDSEPFLTVGDLLAHLADALGMDTEDEEGPLEREALGENILETIGTTPSDGSWLDTDSRTLFTDRLLQALEQDSVADPDAAVPALAAYLHLCSHDGARMIEALLQVAMAADDSYCEGCERRGLPLNAARYCPECAQAAVAAGEGDRVGEPPANDR
jgi:hypothetical protein